jgi:hypothetical protein
VRDAYALGGFKKLRIGQQRFTGAVRGPPYRPFNAQRHEGMSSFTQRFVRSLSARKRVCELKSFNACRGGIQQCTDTLHRALKSIRRLEMERSGRLEVIQAIRQSTTPSEDPRLARLISLTIRPDLNLREHFALALRGCTTRKARTRRGPKHPPCRPSRIGCVPHEQLPATPGSHLH